MLPVPHGGRQCAEYIERITFLEFLISTDSILLQNQHGIAKTKETIFLFYGHFIGRHGLFVAVQRGHQHDEGALRQVEVGDEAVDAVELDTRVQEDGGVATAGFDLAILGGNGFQGAAAGGSNRNDAVPGALVSRMRWAVSSLAWGR